MRRLFILLAIAAPLFAVNPVATQIGTPSAFNGSLYDSDATITFSASGAYNRMELMYSPTQHCAGVAPATYLGAGGLIQPPDNQGSFFNTSFNTINFGGLSYGTTYHVCIGLSNDGGSTWNNANEYDITTLAKQDHTVRPAKRFNSELPDMTGATTVTVASDCSDANTLIDAAVDRQGTTPTKIIFPTGNSCNPPVAFGLYHQFNFQHYAQDLITFNDTEITTGSPGLFAFSSGIVAAMTNGDLVTYDNHTGGEGGISIGSSCPNNIGMADGMHFYITKVDSTHIKLSCEGVDGNPLTTFVAVSSAAHATHGYQFVPWHKVTGTCLDTTGRKACTYWARNLKWIVMESANAETVKMPPYGVRTDPSYFNAGLGSTIVDPLVNAGGTGPTQAAWIFGDVDGNDHTMAGNIMVRGLEFTFANDPSNNQYCNIFQAQPFVGPVVFVQNYFHGGGTPQRWGGLGCTAFQFEGTNFSFRDNYIDNMTNWSSTEHEGSSATMSQGPGPIEYWNNHTEGVGVAIHFDDANGYASTGMWMRGDNYVARNFFYSPTKYMFGSPDSDGFYYGQRQPLEFKAGYRDQVVGNYMKYTWAEITGASVAIAATSVNGIGITDLDISNNWIDHGVGLTNFSSNTNGGEPQTIPPNRVKVHNNLATDISSTWAVTGASSLARGWFIEGPLGGCCNTADHNTLVNNDGSLPVISVLFNTSSSDTAFINNILYFRAAGRGMVDSGTVGTNNACAGLSGGPLATCRLPGAIFQGNFFGSQDATQANINTWWPGSLNYVASNPADQTVIKYRNASQQNYALDYTSPYNSGSATLSTDHKDVGVDMTELNNNLGVTKISGITGISSSGAQINYYNPDGMACYADVLTHAWPITGSDTPLRFVDAAPAQGNSHITLTGLSSSSFYYPRLECATYQDTDSFKTLAPSGNIILQTLSGCSTAGSGGNDTTCIQNAFNSTATGLQTLEMPAPSSGFYNVGPLTAPSHLSVVLDSGTHIKANTGIGDGIAIITGDNNTNISFVGAGPSVSTIEGRKSEYTLGESRHCIRFGGSTDVLFSGIACNNSGGDGIYIGEGSRGYALRVEVANALFDNNSRNGITIISCDTCNIHDTTSSNTKGENGAAAFGPWAGIDIEPNNDGTNPWSLDRLVNITLANLTLSNNGVSTDHAASNGNGFTCHLDLLTAANSPANTSISGSNITSNNNVNTGFHVTNEHDVTGNTGAGKAGNVAITSSHATSNGMYGTRAFFYDAGGPVFSYTSSTNTNNNVLGTTIDNADMSIERGGGGVNAMGGIQWTGDSITSTNGNLQYYFDVEDFSSVGLSNIVIGTFGTLSGRTGSTNGLLNGSGVASVSIP